MIARRLATPLGRGSRVVFGVALALVALVELPGVIAFLVIMLGAEIALGGALNLCILCPLFGHPFQGRKVRSLTAR